MQRLGPAAQHRCLQTRSILLLNLTVKCSNFRNPHGPHRDDAVPLQVAHRSHRLLGHRAVSQHRDHGVPIPTNLVEVADVICPGVQEFSAAFSVAVPDPQFDSLGQQPVADGLTEQTCAEQGNAGHRRKMYTSVSAHSQPLVGLQAETPA